MEKLNIKGRMMKFVKNFVSGRCISVLYNEHILNEKRTSTGLPQGSILSLVLFNIFINGVFDKTLMKIKISIFADDCAFWASSKDFEMLSNRVRLMLNRLTEWSNIWGSVFYASKSTGVIFTKKRLPQYPVLTLNNQQIPIETSVKFLGMIFDQGLTWENK